MEIALEGLRDRYKFPVAPVSSVHSSGFTESEESLLVETKKVVLSKNICEMYRKPKWFDPNFTPRGSA
jgi:hypothetical protein